MADRQVVLELLIAERRTIVGHEAALRTGLLGREATTTVRRLRDHEAQHAELLESELRKLGGTPPPPLDDAVPALADAGGERAVLDFVRELEEVAVAAYYDAQQKVRDSRLLVLLARIMAVEGQHLVLVRRGLGQPLVPQPFETGEP